MTIYEKILETQRYTLGPDGFSFGDILLDKCWHYIGDRTDHSGLIIHEQIHDDLVGGELISHMAALV